MMIPSNFWMKVLHFLFHWCHTLDKWKFVGKTLFLRLHGQLPTWNLGCGHLLITTILVWLIQVYDARPSWNLVHVKIEVTWEALIVTSTLHWRNFDSHYWSHCETVFFLAFWPRWNGGDTDFLSTDFMVILNFLGRIIYKQLFKGCIKNL